MSSPYNIGPILTPKSKLLTLFMFLRETTKFSMWDNRKAYLLLKFNGVVRIIHIEHGHISTCLYRLVSQHTHAKIYINMYVLHFLPFISRERMIQYLTMILLSQCSFCRLILYASNPSFTYPSFQIQYSPLLILPFTCPSTYILSPYLYFLIKPFSISSQLSFSPPN